MRSFALAAAVATALYTSVVTAAELDTEGLPDTGLDISSWTAGQKPPLSDLYNLHDFQLGVKNFLGIREYAYIRTGSLDELTYKANLDIWRYVKLRPHQHFGRDVANVSISTTLRGVNFSLPFFIAPAGYSGYTDPDQAEINLVRAAGTFGAMYSPSILTTKTTAEIAAAKAPGQTLFRQLYPWANHTRFLQDLREAEQNGFHAIFLTLDNPTQVGLRTRALREGAPNSSGQYSTDRSLETAASFQQLTTLPIIPKGIISWQDAKRCMDLGFKAIYLSNHGGRLIETAPTAVEILLELHKNAPEVIRRLEIYADGGVRHGTDIVKLLALGADAVGVGRPAVFANAWGVDGVEKMFQLLKDEVETTLKLLGATDIKQLDRTYLNTKQVENWLF